MANRYFVMGQVFIADGTTTTDKAGRQTTDQTITVTGGAGNFTIFMTEGITGTVTSGTAAITGSVVTLSVGANTLTADGNGTCTLDITIGTAANTNTVNNWSASTGGTGGATVPTSADNAYFDANSFTGASQVLTVDATANCLDMDWTGATNTPTLALTTNRLDFYGDVTLISAMVITGTTGRFNVASSGAQSFRTNGVSVGCRFMSATGAPTLTLLDNFTQTYSGADAISWFVGTLNTGNFTITSSGGFLCTGASVRTVTLGSSTINCVSFDMSGSNQTLTADTSTINASGYFSGGGLTYNKVNLTGATSTITGSNIFAQLGLTRSGVQTITFTDGSTQTVTNMKRSAGTNVKTLVGSSTAGWNLTKQGGGKVGLDYLALSYSVATAGKFYAGANSTNTVGNTGWVFTKKPEIAVDKDLTPKLAIDKNLTPKIVIS